MKVTEAEVRAPETKPSKEGKEMLPFVTQYQPLVSPVKEALMEEWNLIQNQPLMQFFTKNNLDIQNVRVGVSLCVQLTSLHYFLWCPGINRETKFALAIKALVKYTIMLHNEV